VTQAIIYAQLIFRLVVNTVANTATADSGDMSIPVSGTVIYKTAVFVRQTVYHSASLRVAH